MKTFQAIIFVAAFVAAASEPHGNGWGSWGRPDYDSWNSHSQGQDYHGWGNPSNGGGNQGWASTSRPAAQIQADKRSLDELYRAAIVEGGRLIVYAGGDTAGQQDDMKRAFEKQFPGVTLDIIVDFSKNHDARIDLQIASNNLIPDVVQLQTLQDFPRWKSEGHLLPYKPVGWDAVYSQFKDNEGYYTGIFVDAFSNLINRKILTNQATWPLEAMDYLRPDLYGKIVATYPNDDDAVLFWFKLVVEKYGWDWVTAFNKQNVTYVRGTQYPSDYVYEGKSVATFTTDGTLKPDADSDAIFALPKKDPFVSWAQQAAIFKKAKHPAAAKLYLGWLLDTNTQSNIWYMWSVRKDVLPPPGFKSIFDYPNTDPVAFARFMADRTEAERFRAEVTQIIGEVKGESPPGQLGLYPTQALPH